VKLNVRQIIIVMHFRIIKPVLTVRKVNFCDMFTSNQVDANTHTLAKYLMELTIVEYDLVHLNPSEIAAASLCLAMKLVFDTPEWVSFPC